MIVFGPNLKSSSLGIYHKVRKIGGVWVYSQENVYFVAATCDKGSLKLQNFDFLEDLKITGFFFNNEARYINL